MREHHRTGLMLVALRLLAVRVWSWSVRVIKPEKPLPTVGAGLEGRGRPIQRAPELVAPTISIDPYAFSTRPLLEVSK